VNTVLRYRDFLSVRHSNIGTILHHLWDTATYSLKSANLYTLFFGVPRSLCSLWTFVMTLTIKKLESWTYTPLKTA